MFLNQKMSRLCLREIRIPHLKKEHGSYRKKRNFLRNKIRNETKIVKGTKIFYFNLTEAKHFSILICIFWLHLIGQKCAKQNFRKKDIYDYLRVTNAFEAFCG